VNITLQMMTAYEGAVPLLGPARESRKKR